MGQGEYSPLLSSTIIQSSLISILSLPSSLPLICILPLFMVSVICLAHFSLPFEVPVTVACISHSLPPTL